MRPFNYDEFQAGRHVGAFNNEPVQLIRDFVRDNGNRFLMWEFIGNQEAAPWVTDVNGNPVHGADGLLRVGMMPIKKVVFVNIYPSATGVSVGRNTFTTREAAEAARERHGICTAAVEWEE